MSNLAPENISNNLLTSLSPLTSLSMMIQVTAQALANATQNATFVQQQQNMIIQTNTSVSVSLLHEIGAKYSQK